MTTAGPSSGFVGRLFTRPPPAAAAAPGPSRTVTKAPLPPTVVVLGMTGDGKSNLCTWLLGDPNLFEVSDQAESCTEEPIAHTGKCFGTLIDYCDRWTVVDTPGLSDSAGRDAANLRATVALLKERVGHVTAFVLVVNAQQDRMSAALKNTIKVFRACFGPGWWRNLCLVFTKWDWEKKHGGFTTAKLQRRKAEWAAWFKQCEMEYSGLEGQVVDTAEIQLFGVDLPSLGTVLTEDGPDAAAATLTDIAKDGFSSTGDQVRALHRHITVVLTARPAVSMQLAEAKTQDLPGEVARRLKAAEEQWKKQEAEHRQELQAEKERSAKEAEVQRLRLIEEKAAREAEQRAAKATEERLAREVRAAQEQLRLEAQRHREAQEREALERAARQRQEERARVSAQSYYAPSPSPSFSPPATPSGSSSSSTSRNSWNDFQHAHRGQGFTSTQLSKMYKER
jgi:hypothetical protein